MKATYGEVFQCTCNKTGKDPYGTDAEEACEHYHDNPPDWCMKKPEGREIFKDPITDSGEKKSARGLLRVDLNEQGEVTLYQQQTKEQEDRGLLKIIFFNGVMVRKYSLADIRERLRKNS